MGLLFGKLFWTKQWTFGPFLLHFLLHILRYLANWGSEAVVVVLGLVFSPSCSYLTLLIQSMEKIRLVCIRGNHVIFRIWQFPYFLNLFEHCLMLSDFQNLSESYQSILDFPDHSTRDDLTLLVDGWPEVLLRLLRQSFLDIVMKPLSPSGNGTFRIKSMLKRLAVFRHTVWKWLFFGQRFSVLCELHFLLLDFFLFSLEDLCLNILLPLFVLLVKFIERFGGIGFGLVFV